MKLFCLLESAAVAKGRVAEGSGGEMEGWNPMREDFLSARNSLQVDNEHAGLATVGYSTSLLAGFLVLRWFVVKYAFNKLVQGIGTAI